MTSNNLEAIELLKITKRHIQDGYEASAEALVEKAIELLQADEVKNKPPQHDYDFPEDCWCREHTMGVLAPPKPTKETKQSKLMELKYRVTPEVNILASVVLDLIDILEEEY